ncbi:30S ribosomal protein S4 [Candidatus Bathyarchaeota archaeon]|nr:MAG: 30S ribosomal protein S4 [Candidatus Bathyarchaeota archaeon]
MGDPKKKHKKYKTPKRPYDEERLREELRLIGTYGLRNKRELWRHRTMLRKYRRIAREMLSLEPAERAKGERELIRKLYALGLISKGATLEDVLGLRIEDILERRLQTLVYRKGMASSLFQARQLIVHGHIAVGGKKVTSPGYIVPREEEGRIGYTSSSPLAVATHPLRQELTALQGLRGEGRGE